MKTTIILTACFLIWCNAISMNTSGKLVLHASESKFNGVKSTIYLSDFGKKRVIHPKEVGREGNVGIPISLGITKEIDLLDTIRISSNSKSSNRIVYQYQTYKSVLINQTGFSTEIEFGTGGGGKTMFSMAKFNEPDYTMQYQHQFRSQHISIAFRYNYKNMFASLSYTREHIQPQDGKRIENIPGIGTVTYPGLNNFFPKDKNYYGINIGYDLRNSFRLFFSPFVGVNLYSYQGSKKVFNDMHKDRVAYNVGLKSYFVTQSNLLFFVQFYYSRQLFKQQATLVKDPRTYDMVSFIDNNMSHNQVFISFGFQFKLSNRFN